MFNLINLQHSTLKSESLDLRHLDGFIRVGDEGDEERQHHVDERWDERVEVRPTEEPHQGVLVLQLGEGGEHVVAVQEREQTLGHTTQLLKLEGRSRNGGHRRISEWNFSLCLKQNETVKLLQNLNQWEMQKRRCVQMVNTWFNIACKLSFESRFPDFGFPPFFQETRGWKELINMNKTKTDG